MRNLTLVRTPLIAALFAPLLFAAPSQGQLTERHTFASDAVSIHNLAGEIRVVASTAPDIEVSVARGGSDAESLRIETSGDGAGETLRVHYPDARIVYPPMGRASRSQWSTSNDNPLSDLVPRGSREITVVGSGRGTEAHADITVHLPAGSRLSVHHGVGRVELENVEGDLDVNVRSASVSAEGIRGPVRVNGRSGAVRLLGVRGDLRARTRSGSIEAHDIRGETVRLAARSGSIQATDLEFERGELSARSGRIRVERARGERLTAETRSGRIEGSEVEAGDVGLTTRSGGARIWRLAAGTLRAESRSGDVDLELTRQVASTRVTARSGRVTLRVPPEFAAQLDLQSRGSIRVDVPVAAVQQTRDAFRGRIGDGGVPVEVRNRSGGIRVVGG